MIPGGVDLYETKLISWIFVKEQARLPEFLERWKGVERCTEPADREKAQEGVRLAYRFAGLCAPEIIWRGSPHACYLAACERRPQWGLGSIKDRIWKSAKSEALNRVSKRLQWRVLNYIDEDMRRRLRAIAGEPTVLENIHFWSGFHNDGVMGTLGQGIEIALRPENVSFTVGADHIRRVNRLDDGVTEIDYVRKCGYGQQDAQWLWVFDFIGEVIGLQEEIESIRGLMLLAQSAGWYLPQKETCFISERLSEFHLDREGRFHKEGGLALAYPDGWGMYVWHGTRIPARMGRTRSERWDPRWLLDESNSQVRGALIRAIGYERIMAIFRSSVIHQEGEMELRQINNKVDIEPIVLLKVKCPSTGLVFALRVPPNVETCEQARNWTFGLPDEDAERFDFIRET